MFVDEFGVFPHIELHAEKEEDKQWHAIFQPLQWLTFSVTTKNNQQLSLPSPVMT